MNFPFYSTKTFHQAFPVAYRQWRADSHCRLLHGYALTVHLEFGGFNLDARSWLVDFGGLRGLKGQLEDWFDHTQLVAVDDPSREALLELGRLKIAKITEVERTGCEGLSDFIFEHLNDGWLKINGYGDRVICTKVEVRETQSNMAMRCLTESDYRRFTEAAIPSNPVVSAQRGDLRWHEHGRDLLLATANGAVMSSGVVYQSPGYTVNGATYLTQQAAMTALAEFYK